MANPDTIALDPAPTYYTADAVRARIEADDSGVRYECVFGELLVSPSPTGLHQAVVTRLLERLLPYVRVGALPYMVFTSPADISWGRDDVVVQPDVFVVGQAEAAAVMAGGPWTAVTHLWLAIEIMSPSSRRADRFSKRRLYQVQGVPLYVAIDPVEKTGEVWTVDARFPVIERERLTWHPDGAPEPLVISLAELFAEP